MVKLTGCTCTCRGGKVSGKRHRKRKGRKRISRKTVARKGSKKAFGKCMSVRLKGKHYRNRVSQRKAWKTAARVCRK